MNRPVTRRQLLRLGSAAVALPVLTFGGRGSANAAANRATTTMWRLQSDWGFPVGPDGRTSCRCNACRAHSANKLFFERGDAETSRAHQGCRCVAEPVVLATSRTILQAMSADGRSIDRRHGGHTTESLRRLT